MKHAVTRDLHAYWQRLRGRRLAPERGEIEPSDIRSILGDTFILEVASDASFRFRLAGTRVCALYGRELKGKDFLSFWTGRDRATCESLMQAVTEEAAAAVFGLELQSAHGRTLAGEAIVLPVRQSGPGFSRVLGAIATHDQPYWVGIHPIMNQTITSMRMIWPSTRPGFGDQTLHAPNDETDIEAMLAPLPTEPARRVGHLTVLEGGRSD
jgi:hypothetical protein